MVCQNQGGSIPLKEIRLFWLIPYFLESRSPDNTSTSFFVRYERLLYLYLLVADHTFNIQIFKQENYDFLMRCIKENMGFKDSKPVSACVIYKCLSHWQAFELERTSIFDYVMDGINEALKVASQTPCVFDSASLVYHT